MSGKVTRLAKSVAKSAMRRTVNALGVEVFRVPRASSQGPPHETVRPLATYAPWNSDALFLETYAAVKDHTLVDVYRCYELWSLVEQSKKLDGNIVEVGVWRGGTGALIARRAQLCEIECRVYLCDTFSGVVKAGSEDWLYKGGEHADTSRQIVEALVRTLGLRNVQILEGIFPDESAHAIPREQLKFRLCHVDVDVYESARDVVLWIWEKLAVGGIVVFDDYGFYGCSGVTKFVNEQARESGRLVLHNLNGHAIVIKIAD
jgi:O-methyltransferase